MQSKLVSSAILAIIVFGLYSCSKSSMSPAAGVSNIGFQSTLSGSSATPANGSKATGSATFTYNPATYILSGTVTAQ